MSAGAIRIGTSGWNYPSGRGTWNGVFYPAKGRRRSASGFDELSYYAEHFDTVEVNSTFYRVPDPSVTQRWVERTPSRFEFSIKLYQKFTHPKMFRAASRTDDVTVDTADVDLVRRAIDPLRRADKLGALLAQFPPSFKNDASTQVLSRVAAHGIHGLFGRGRAPTPQLERRCGCDADTPQQPRCRMGPDRRAKVPLLNRAKLSA